MAYDVLLEERINDLIESWQMKLPTKKMFGGLAYMLNGNMVFGIMRDELLIRASDADGELLFQQHGIRRFQLGIHQSKSGWYLVDGDVVESDKRLGELLTQSRDYVLQLPPRKHKK